MRPAGWGPGLLCGLLALGCRDGAWVTRDRDNELACTVHFRTARPAEAEVRFGHGGRRWVVRGERGQTRHRVAVYGLRPETDYRLEVRATAGGREVFAQELPWTSGRPPPLVADFEVDPYDPAEVQPGWTLLNLQDPAERSVAAIYDLDGHPVWYRELKGTGGVIDASWTDRGTVLLGGTLPQGDRAEEVGLDGEVWWTGPRQVAEGRTGQQHHHHERLPGGHLLWLEKEVIDGVVGDRAVEQTPEGEEVWAWRTFAHLDPPARQGDWTHANWVHRDGDRAWISLAALGQIVAIDTATGAIDWVLGRGGTLELVGGGAWFGFQHQPVVLPDGHLLVYDNRGAGDRSRVVEYAIDEAEGTATEVWAYDGGEDNPWQADFMGSVQLLDDGHLLIAAGGDRQDRRVFEITREGRLVWRMRTGKVYRARRIPEGLEEIAP